MAPLGFVRRVQGTLALICRVGVRVTLVPDQRLNGRDKRPGHQQQVVIQHTHQVEQRVETRRYLPGFDAGDVNLRQANAAAQLSLAPSARQPRREQIAKNIGWEAA
jgi:hypothetical protein